jgi:hypothetical protein
VGPDGGGGGRALISLLYKDESFKEARNRFFSVYNAVIIMQG